MGQDISITDWKRIIIGDTSWIFLVEVVGRSLLVYLLLLLFMRLMGKRVAAQMSATELTVILMLGAAIGLPIQAPDNGVLPGVVVLTVILICHRGLSYMTLKKREVEVLTHGNVIILVRDGHLLPSEMRRVYFSSERLFALLRTEGIEHLGQVRRVYLEAWGNLSLIRYRRAKPGLLILPELSGRHREVEGVMACGTCGNLGVAGFTGPCHLCGNECWKGAVE